MRANSAEAKPSLGRSPALIMAWSSVAFGPTYDTATIFTTGLVAQLLPIAPCPRERRKFAEMRHTLQSV